MRKPPALLAAVALAATLLLPACVRYARVLLAGLAVCASPRHEVDGECPPPPLPRP